MSKPSDKEAVAAERRETQPTQSMLYVNGSKVAYRHECGSNVFTKLERSGPEAESIRKHVPESVRYVYRCNGCQEFVWEDTEAQ